MPVQGVLYEGSHHGTHNGHCKPVIITVKVKLYTVVNTTVTT